MVSLLEEILGQQHSGPLRRRKTGGWCSHKLTNSAEGELAALTARGSIRKAKKGLGSGAAQGSAECRKNWTAALIPRSLGSGTHPTSAENAQAARVGWGGGRYTAARGVLERTKSQQNKYRVALARQTGAHECSGPTGERQEHVDAIISFAGAGQRRRLCRGLDIQTIKGKSATYQKNVDSSSTRGSCS